MRYVPRRIEPTLLAAARRFPAVILTGPRRSGKTTLLRHTFPRASYHLLEDPDLVGRVRADPRGFLEAVRTPAILDEIQHTPELLSYVRTLVDARPRRTGRWLLTGSQEAPLMRGVTESLAGRAAVLQLLPLSVEETPRVTLLRGGYPEAVARPSAARLWFSSYVQTYLERDVRAVSAIRDLATFRRFLGLVATRSGQLLNKTDLAAPLGVSVPTITEWVSILAVTGQVALVPPWFESFGKRLVKSPKLYLLDSGLAAFLLGIESEHDLSRSPFLGPLFEAFVASEIVKRQVNGGRRRELYYFRDQQGLEVDFVVPVRGRKLLLLEAKASRTVRPEMAESLARLSRAVRTRKPQGVLVFRGVEAGSPTTALRPGVQALPLAEALTLVG
jgi:predicted AAA+ superfamily ATPase